MSDASKGWECPKCGKCHAPWVAHCSCMGEPPQPIWIRPWPYYPNWPTYPVHPTYQPYTIWCGTTAQTGTDAKAYNATVTFQ